MALRAVEYQRSFPQEGTDTFENAVHATFDFSNRFQFHPVARLSCRIRRIIGDEYVCELREGILKES